MGLVEGRSQYNWDHGVACKNPHCKSYGKSHPNCQCTSAGPQTGAAGGSGPAGPSKSTTALYAEGGAAEGSTEEHPCTGPHQSSCEYYAGNPDLGKSVLQNAIGRHDSEDDVTNAMLGKSHPEHAMHGLTVSSGASGILGKIQDSLFGTSEKKGSLSDIANKRLSKNASKFLNKVSMISPEKSMSPSFIKDVIRPAVKKMIGQNNPHVIDAVINALSKGETDNLGSIIKHAKGVSKGYKSIEDSIDSLFSGGNIEQDPSDDDREKLKEFIKKGGLNAQIMNQNQGMAEQPVQAMAKGGEINANAQKNPVDKTFPEHSMQLGMAKSSINNYLQQQEPQHDVKLPFDSEHKNGHKERAYNTALDVANKPLSVLKHAQNGTLVPEHMKHLVGMYPDLYSHLGKKATERIVKAQMYNEKPSYRVRQSLSLFLGSPLDSTMTPQAIQSIQSIYAPKPAAPQPEKAPKSTSKMGKISEDHYTGDQAAEKRQTAWD